jgi:DNA-binding MarR family transcriptional regulator
MEQKRFARALVNMDRGMDRVARQCSRGCGITHEQSKTLQLIAERGSVGVGALGSLLGIAKSTMSRNLSTLQEKGLVERRKISASDKRETEVSLTASGRIATKMLGVSLFNVLGDLMKSIPRTERKRILLALEEVALVLDPSSPSVLR